MRSPWVWLAAALLRVGALVRVSAIPPSIADGSVAHASAYVVYDGASYTPSSVTIKKGGTVTFTSTGPLMWVATDAHPLHRDTRVPNPLTSASVARDSYLPLTRSALGATTTISMMKQVGR